jgi:hypothetical protein
MQRFIRGDSAYHDSPERGGSVWNALMTFQPWLARIGFLGSLLVMASASAQWWFDTSRTATVVSVASAFGPVSCRFPAGISAFKFRRNLYFEEIRPNALVTAYFRLQPMDRAEAVPLSIRQGHVGDVGAAQGRRQSGPAH